MKLNIHLLFVILAMGILTHVALANDNYNDKGYYSTEQISAVINFLSEYWSDDQFHDPPGALEKWNKIAWLLLGQYDRENVNRHIQEVLFYIENQKWPDIDWYQSRCLEQKCNIIQRPEGMALDDTHPVMGGEDWAAYSIAGPRQLAVANMCDPTGSCSL
jgi:hypothetical protein